MPRTTYHKAVPGRGNETIQSRRGQSSVPKVIGVGIVLVGLWYVDYPLIEQLKKHWRLIRRIVVGGKRH